MWCGGGHLHKECPEKENTSSTPSCCNCKLAEGEKPHPSNYRGCSRAKDEIRRRRSTKAAKPTPGRVFTSSYTTPGLSFAAALGKKAEKTQQSQTHQNPVTAETTVAQGKASAALQQNQAGQSVQATPVNSDTERMFRAYAAAGQIMNELKDAGSEEAQFLTLGKFIFNLMKRNDK
jgi:hypothetical protein